MKKGIISILLLRIKLEFKEAAKNAAFILRT